MVFPTVPVYLDPRNWNQQQTHNYQPQSSSGEPPQPTTRAVAPCPEGPVAGSIRPGSMVDRARLAKIPQPEPSLKCPRCDSTNTKFCYFNNYSLTQPRHFCKTCRRYWTRGGALRNVPVGGGCRRNKRTKPASSNTSKSSNTTTADRQVGASSTAPSVVGISGAIPSNLPMPPQLPFMGMAATLHPLAEYNTPGIGLSFSGIQPVDHAVDYHVGVSGSSGGGGVGMEQWRLPQIQQFPFLGGLEPPPPPAPVSGLYPFDGEGSGADGGAFAKATGSGLITQLASVKMEDNQHRFGLPRQYLGVPRNDQYWGSSSGGGSGSGSGWAPDLSGFNSSSAGNLL